MPVTALGAALLMGGDQGLGDVGGHLSVVGGAGAKVRSAARERAQIHGVAPHLALRDVRADRLVAGFVGRLDSDDVAPAGVEVAHQVAQIRVGDRDLNV